MFNNWWEQAKDIYGLRSITGSARDSSVFMYDPLIDYRFMTNAGGHLLLAHGLLGHKHEDARLLFKGAAQFLGWNDSGEVVDSTTDLKTLEPTPKGTILGLVLAREFGEDAIYAKLKAHAEEKYEPTWDEASGEFTWGFGLDEPYPRGQYNGQMAEAEAVSRDATWRIYNEPNLKKFIEPTVYGVDFPTVCLSQAYYDADKKCLVVATDKGLPAASGRPTSFRVTNVNPNDCLVTVDGEISEGWRAVDGDIEIRTTVAEHTFLVHAQAR